ncbi:MAG: helix-turn-helix domain-containing protein [Pseudorhodoplanes sp.]
MLGTFRFFGRQRLYFEAWAYRAPDGGEAGAYPLALPRGETSTAPPPGGWSVVYSIRTPIKFSRNKCRDSALFARHQWTDCRILEGDNNVSRVAESAVHIPVSVLPEIEDSGLNRMTFSSRPAKLPIEFHTFRRKRWPGMIAEFARIVVPATFDFSVKLAAPRVTLLDIFRTDGETTFSGYPRTATKNLRDKLSFSPTGMEISGWSKLDKPASYLTIAIEPTKDSHGADLSRIPMMRLLDDTMLRTMLMQLRSMIIDPSLDMPGYAETLGILLPFEIQRLHRQKESLTSTQGGLTPRQFRSVLDYMENRLSQDISIAEIAESVELSRFHFIRAFKKTAGVPPHRYFLARRVERAKELLRNPQMTITEASELAGFGSTTQLTRAFRKIIGVTPSAFRKDAL